MTKWLDRRIAAAGPYLTLCLNEKDFFTALAHLRCKERPAFMAASTAQATAHFLDNPKGELVAVICLTDWKGRNPIEVAGLLVHEAVHVVQRYFGRIGEHRPGDEQQAYGVQAVAQELMDSFVQQTKGGRRA